MHGSRFRFRFLYRCIAVSLYRFLDNKDKVNPSFMIWRTAKTEKVYLNIVRSYRRRRGKKIGSESNAVSVLYTHVNGFRIQNRFRLVLPISGCLY